MNAIKIIWSWLERSSKDPAKLSMTFKGIIPFLIFFGLENTTDIEGAADSLANVLILTAQWISGLIALWGFLRKVYITFGPKKE